MDNESEEPPDLKSPVRETSNPQLFSDQSASASQGPLVEMPVQKLHRPGSNGNGNGHRNGNGRHLDLLSGATSHTRLLSEDSQPVSIVARDHSRPLQERLEAFEDIYDSEVGDTSLQRVRNIEREVGLRQIYLKFEGSNPTGSQKDRIAFAQVMDALRRNFSGITVATCGNYGAAMAFAASVAGMPCYIYIPETYHTKRIEEMQEYGAEVIRVPGDYENAVRVSRERADEDDVYDANPGSRNTPLQLMTYGQIAVEIYDELRDAPAVVAVPVSNGTTLAGIYRGFLSLYRRGKTSRMPRIVAGSSYGKNPIVQAFLRKLALCEDLEPDKRHIKETAVNEPLINWHSSDGNLALDGIRQTGGWAEHGSDRSMLHYARMIRELEGLNVLPASTAGLLALVDFHQENELPGDRYVVVITGKK